MIEAHEQPIDVYSASAGSGKTYTLASRYIDMLISKPTDYRNILAVTFTNKATAEMMSRIIDDLYIIASDKQKLTPEQQKKQTILIQRQKKCMTTPLSDALIQQRCQVALRLILNDYRMFNISTIDSFVQRIIRAFAFEMGFPASYSIELDTTLVINESIDNMMRSLGENKELSKWIIEYLNSQADEGKWSIDKAIFNLAKKILDDKGREFMNDVEEKLRQNHNLMLELKKQINTDISTTEEQFEAAMNAFASGYENGFPYDNLKGKSRAPANTIYNKCTDAKNSIYDRIYAIYQKKEKSIEETNDAEILAKVKVLFNTITDEKVKNYRTAYLIKKNIYVIGIMSYLSEHINRWKRQNDTLPMSDSNDLLSRLIDKSELPFIYEKIGTRFQNIMIDEFQDTSGTQWDNFKPLISENIDNGHKSLLVGDTKQSIYRWRNSDWHNLANVDQIFPCQKHLLDINWRSKPSVVAFNNAMFSYIKDRMASVLKNADESDSKSTEIIDVFESCLQKVPQHKKSNDTGFVQIRLLPQSKSKKESDNDELSPKDIAINEMLSEIAKLHTDYCYNYGDICILVRDHKDGALVMNALHAEGIDAVSTDSLKLTSSLAVKGILGALQYMANPNDKTALIAFMAASVFAKNDNVSQLLNVDNQIVTQLLSLNGLGLIEIVSQLVSDYIKPELVRTEFMFIEALTDTIRSYLSKGRVNLSDFIEYIDKQGDKLTVIAPPSQTAVKVMTIHKSKGLEFKAVLIPFADWDILPRNGDIMWVSTNVKDIPSIYSPFVYVPINFAKTTMSDTWFEQAYIDEKRMLHIDNLNLLYVALTRAENVLMVWGHQTPDKAKTEAASHKTPFDYMLDALAQYTKIDIIYSDNTTDQLPIVRDEIDTDGSLTFTVGEITSLKSENEAEQNEQIEQYPLHKWNIRMAHTATSELDDEPTTNRELGIEMHAIMEKVRTLSDIEPAFANAVCNGELTQTEAQECKAHLNMALQDATARSWFDVSAECVYNEMSFYGNKQIKRPDRVLIDKDKNVIVIDYKFCQKTDQNIRKYSSQVTQYVNLFHQIGYKNVSGFVWYLGDDINYKPEIIRL